jgi:hypothetical protein
LPVQKKSTNESWGLLCRRIRVGGGWGLAGRDTAGVQIPL